MLTETPLTEMLLRTMRDRAGHVALTDSAGSLTFRELDSASLQVARAVLRASRGRIGNVGLAAGRDRALVIAMLGILRSGNGYVPLDPAYPEERRNFITADAHLLAVARADERGAIRVVATDQPEAEREPAGDAGGERDAYIIYTSGSTGQPKGVRVTHANLHWLISNAPPCFEFTPQDVWALNHSYNFDFSVWEVFAPLSMGARLFVVPHNSITDATRHLADLVRHGVTVHHAVPSAFRYLCRALDRVDASGIKRVILGGELLDCKNLGAWWAANPSTVFYNIYGATEGTVFSTFRPFPKSDLEQAGTVRLIGDSVPGSGIELRGSTSSATREIVITGDGVTKGYLHRPELTAERFVRLPEGQRAYLTGDQATVTADGTLAFMGRDDDQVKVNGYRIELGEIEQHLSRLNGVEAAAVIVRDLPNGLRQLAAFYTGSAQPAAVTEGLSAIPRHLRPTSVRLVDALPVNANGKVDRKALGAGGP